METEQKEQIEYDDFAKLELKLGKILACERVEGSEKLLKSTVEMGEQTRTIVSGISRHYNPEEMVGKTVVVVANLKPIRLRGILSEGMLLCAENGEELSVLTSDRILPSGSVVL